MTKVQTSARNALLRSILAGRQRELQDDLQRHLRDGRTDQLGDVHEELEHSDANNSADVSYALLQMTAETMRRIDEAIARLDAGAYGLCLQCGKDIADTRLRALPFAVRCTTCETARERLRAEARRLSQEAGGQERFAGLAPA